LLLKNRQLGDEVNRKRILAAMSAHGIAESRIDLRSGADTPGWQDHMAYYDQLDIGLDPVQTMSGSTTTCDALWMGVPVVTLTGDRVGSRMTTSKLHALGHAEWIASSGEDYVGKIVALARDAERRKQIRLGLREEMAHSALCDARGLARSLEDAYFEMRLRAASA
jgi:predicted O-linked N-acetylglucosamine transferase (SPINDLY family)